MSVTNAMRSLQKTSFVNLSKSINLFSNNILNFNKFTFSGGEEHIKFKLNEDDNPDRVVLISSMKNSSDVMSLFMATDAVRNQYPEAKIETFLPYFPYARQDRVMVDGEPFSVGVMSNILNTFSFDRVHVYDPHSDVTPALINNVRVIDNSSFVASALKNIENSFGESIVVSPDAGAEKKIYNLAEKLKLNDVVLGSKHRDVTTGKLTNFDFRGDVKDKNCVMVDDIADGGGTFIGLANRLKEGGAKSIHLVVSHGIFSKGTNFLLDNGIDSIHTTDSVTSQELSNDTPSLEIYNLWDDLEKSL